MEQRETAKPVDDWVDTTPKKEEPNDWVSSDSPAAQTLAPPVPMKHETTPADDNFLYANMIGVSPFAMAERMKGVAKAAGQAGMTIVQYLQYMAQQNLDPRINVSPTPDILRASTGNQQVGKRVAAMTPILGAVGSGITGAAPAIGAAASNPATVEAAKQALKIVSKGAPSALGTLGGGYAILKALGILK